MKLKKNYAVVTMVLLLIVMLSITGFAEDLTVEVIEDATGEITEVTEEKAEEAVTATVIVDGEEEIVLTVDAENRIISADYAKDLEEEEAVDEEVIEEATEEVTEEEEDTEDVNPLADLEGKTLEEALNTLTDTEEPVAFSVTIYSDDNELIDDLEASLEEAFGDLIEIDTIKAVDLDNPNALRFMMAQELGITPGKMNLLEKLGKGYGDDALTFYEEWADKSVKEIMAEVKQERKSSEEVTISTTDETQTKNSNKPAKAPKTNNGNGKKK